MTTVVDAPLLVYNRIDANRRNTRLLLIWFGLALLPALSGVAACFVVPSLDFHYGRERPAEMAALQDQVRAGRPSPNGTSHQLDLPPALLWLYARFNVEATAIVTLLFVAITAVFVYLYGSRVVLRSAQARLVQPGHEEELVRIVENLCIGAGLPRPRIHVIESAAPNAFATGRTERDASLVVTRGLLELLDRGELEGVIAHELSHIGNHDIAFSTTLAALVGTLSLPLRAVTAPFRWAARRGPGTLVAVIGGFLIIFGPNLFVVPYWMIQSRFYQTTNLVSVRYVLWWSLYIMIASVYAVWVAPVVALLIRQAVSRQREFLADADAALLTRNPESLALALVKISAAGGERLRVGEGTVHLYFVDPRSKGSWIHAVFPSHPSVEKRVELLARMGDGIAPAAIQAARDAGARFHAAAEEAAERASTNEEEALDTSEEAVEPNQTLPAFHEDADPALTPLYEKPDGWSRVLARLPENAAVTAIAAEGAFFRITTANHQVGYVSRSAALTALKNLQP